MDSKIHIVLRDKIDICIDWLSRLSLVLVHGHVFVPIIGQNLHLHPLLLLHRQSLAPLLLHPLLVLFHKADSHVVILGLCVFLGEPQPVHVDWLGNQGGLDFGKLFGWRRPANPQLPLLNCLGHQSSSLLPQNFTDDLVVFELVLLDDFVNDAFERIRLINY